MSIVLDQDPRFTDHFWKSFQGAREPLVILSTKGQQDYSNL